MALDIYSGCGIKIASIHNGGNQDTLLSLPQEADFKPFALGINCKILIFLLLRLGCCLSGMAKLATQFATLGGEGRAKVQVFSWTEEVVTTVTMKGSPGPPTSLLLGSHQGGLGACQSPPNLKWNSKQRAENRHFFTYLKSGRGQCHILSNDYWI